MNVQDLVIGKEYKTRWSAKGDKATVTALKQARSGPRGGARNDGVKVSYPCGAERVIGPNEILRTWEEDKRLRKRERDLEKRADHLATFLDDAEVHIDHFGDEITVEMVISVMDMERLVRLLAADERNRQAEQEEATAVNLLNL